jgi:hypothetical protein
MQSEQRLHSCAAAAAAAAKSRRQEAAFDVPRSSKQQAGTGRQAQLWMERASLA